MSLCAADGEWRTRKINLFAVIKGFVSQIKVGADCSFDTNLPFLPLMNR
jgi:hypothetical protein